MLLPIGCLLVRFASGIAGSSADLEVARQAARGLASLGLTLPPAPHRALRPVSREWTLTGRPGVRGRGAEISVSGGWERDERSKGGRDGHEEGQTEVDVTLAGCDPLEAARRPELEHDRLAVEGRRALACERVAP